MGKKICLEKFSWNRKSHRETDPRILIPTVTQKIITYSISIRRVLVTLTMPAIPLNAKPTAAILMDED
jgi:hypothetical protein